MDSCLLLWLRLGWERTRPKQLLDVILWTCSYELPDSIAGGSGCINWMPTHIKVSSIRCFASNFLEKAKPRHLESEILFFFASLIILIIELCF